MSLPLFQVFCETSALLKSIMISSYPLEETNFAAAYSDASDFRSMRTTASLTTETLRQHLTQSGHLIPVQFVSSGWIRSTCSVAWQ